MNGMMQNGTTVVQKPVENVRAFIECTIRRNARKPNKRKVSRMWENTKTKWSLTRQSKKSWAVTRVIDGHGSDYCGRK